MVIWPGFILSFLFGSLGGLTFRLCFGRPGRSLIFYWLIGIFSFSLGQPLAIGFHSIICVVGGVHILEGLLASWLVLTLANSLRV